MQVSTDDVIEVLPETGAAAGKLSGDTFENVDLPAAPLEHDGRQKAAHRAADHQRTTLRHANTLLFHQKRSSCSVL